MATETVFECPKCHKQGMVRLHSEGDIFECIYCRHTNDLTKGKDTSDDSMNWLVVLILALFAALMVTGL